MSRLNKFYIDKVSVYRFGSYPDGYGGTEEKEDLVHTNIPCRLDVTWPHATNSSEINSSYAIYKLFAAVDVDIKQNDKLVVTRKSGTIHRFKASKPFECIDYIPHVEIVLSEVEENEQD